MADESYKLPKPLHDEIFRTIQADYFADSTPVASPRIIVLGGQPAAGKTALLSASRDAIGDNVVTINSDELRYFHPKIGEIIAKGERLFSPLTDPDTREWTSRLLESAAASRRNIVFEGTMREPGPISATLTRLREAGFGTEARVMAVSDLNSVAGIHLRYEKQRENAGFGRWVDMGKHNAAYSGLLSTVETLESRQLVDRIGIYARPSQLIYENELRDGQWRNPPGGRDSIAQERGRELSLPERAELVNTWQNVLSLMSNRGASQKDFEGALAYASNTPGFTYDHARPGNDYQGRILATDSTRTLQLDSSPQGLRVIEHRTSSLSGSSLSQGADLKISYPMGDIGLVRQRESSAPADGLSRSLSPQQRDRER